jgi:hypothetical protein
LVDASAGGLLVRDSLIPIDSAGVLDIFIVVYNRKSRRVNYIRFLCFHCYHLVDASAGGLLVRDSLIPIDSAGVLDILIVVYYRHARRVH